MRRVRQINYSLPNFCAWWLKIICTLCLQGSPIFLHLLIMKWTETPISWTVTLAMLLPSPLIQDSSLLQKDHIFHTFAPRIDWKGKQKLSCLKKYQNKLKANCKGWCNLFELKFCQIPAKKPWGIEINKDISRKEIPTLEYQTPILKEEQVQTETKQSC